MKVYLIPAAFMLALLLSSFTVYNSINWNLTDDYSIKFTSDNPSGIFKELTGTILFDENDLEGSSFSMSVAAASINTGNGMKNKHARSSKWFDVENYPAITFTSSSIKNTESGYETTGMVQIKDVQKEVTIPFTFNGNVFQGQLTINRLDFNLGVTKGAQGKAAHELLVEIQVPVTQ